MKRFYYLAFASIIIAVVAVFVVAICANSDVHAVNKKNNDTSLSKETDKQKENEDNNQTLDASGTNNKKVEANKTKKRINTDLNTVSVLVNKTYPIEKPNNDLSATHYEPTDLEYIGVYGSNNSEKFKMRKIAVKPLQDMFNDASKAGCGLKAISAYRSYKTQVSVYRSKFSQFDKDTVNSCSALPGTSEHQTGYAIDIANARTGNLAYFKGSKEAEWVKNNSYKYGYIVRYPEGKQNITGYINEPWHIRFVGVTLAKILHDKNITLEEYYETKTDQVKDKQLEDDYYNKYIIKKY